MRFSVMLGAMALLLAAPPAGAAPVVLKLDAATQKRLGVVTQPLAAARRSVQLSGFARVVDPVPLATLDSDISTAAAALAASQAEATRTQALAADQTVAKRVAETALSQRRSDAAKLALLRRRLGLEWGPTVSRLSDARRGQLVADIAAGRASMVRIDASSGFMQQTGGAVNLDLGPAGHVMASIMGPARTTDIRLQSAGLLALVRGPQAMRLGTGAVFPATIAAGGGAAGVIIPRAALLRTEGQTFAYVQRDAGNFERRPVVSGASEAGGLFAPSGFRAGEAVVIAGAARLFAAEHPSAQAD